MKNTVLEIWIFIWKIELIRATQTIIVRYEHFLKIVWIQSKLVQIWGHTFKILLF